MFRPYICHALICISHGKVKCMHGTGNEHGWIKKIWGFTVYCVVDNIYVGHSCSLIWLHDSMQLVHHGHATINLIDTIELQYNIA